MESFVGGVEAVGAVTVVGVVAFEDVDFGTAFDRHHLGSRVGFFPCCPGGGDHRDLLEGPSCHIAIDGLADELDEVTA